MKNTRTSINWPLALMGIFTLADLFYSLICIFRILGMEENPSEKTNVRLLAMAAVTAVLYGAAYICYLIYRSQKKPEVSNPAVAAFPFLWSLLLLCEGVKGNTRTFFSVLFIASFCLLIFGSGALYRKNAEIRDEKLKKDTKGFQKDLDGRKSAVSLSFMDYDWKLEDISRRIKDRNMVAVTQEMEELVVSIFRDREEFPEKRAVIQKFASYYLPASVKLLNRYEELENEPRRTKEQEEWMGRIQSSVSAVRDSLKAVWTSMKGPKDLDLSAEMTVLENKLSGDGLLCDFQSAGLKTENTAL